MKRFTNISVAILICAIFQFLIMPVLFQTVQLVDYPLIASVAALISTFTYFSIPTIGKFLKANGIVGIDVHKIKKPIVPESGGIVLAIGFTMFLGLLYVMTGKVQIIYMLMVSLLFGFQGFIDDIVRLGKYEKFFCSFLIGAVAVLFSGLTGVNIILATLFVVAIGNIFNLLAGLNGLEVGSGAIVSFFFGLCSLIIGSYIPGAVCLGVFLILLSFLFHNKYPAKIFPGNSGTLVIGGLFASMTLYYNLYLILIPLLAVHIFNCVLKGWSAGYFSSSEKKPTKVLKNGVLKPRKDFLSLIRLLLRLKPMKEPETVKTIWILEIIVGILTTAVVGMI